jgi:hypothetical protein
MGVYSRGCGRIRETDSGETGECLENDEARMWNDEEMTKPEVRIAGPIDCSRSLVLPDEEFCLSF